MVFSRKHSIGAHLLFALILNAILSGCREDASVPLQFEQGLQQAISKSRSAVVTIEASFKDSINSQSAIVGRGSGVVIDSDGTIATTCEFISHGDQLVVLFQDGCSVNATLIGADRETNIAILASGSHSCGCFPIDLNRAESEITGSIGILINNSSVSKGVSAGMGIMAESWLGGDDCWGDPLYIAQTGDILTMEGAPVVSLDGKLIGISDAMIESHHGAWTVIPTKTVIKIASELKQNGSLKRGWIGIGCSSEESEQTTPSGVKPHIRINQVIAGSPADLAGLRIGDFIISLNGTSVDDQSQFRSQIASFGENRKLELEILRDAGIVQNVPLSTQLLPDDPHRQRLCSTRSL